MSAFVVAVLAVAASAVVLPVLGARARGPGISAAAGHVRYQAAAVVWAALVVGAVRLAGTVEEGRRWGIGLVGNLDAPARGLSLIGVGDGDRWRTLLPGLGSSITVVTALVIASQLRRQGRIPARRVLVAVPAAAGLAAVNAAVEEAIFRYALVEGAGSLLARGTLSEAAVAMVSAVLFGLPHLRGLPSGALGAVMAGVLGWLLCLSVVQTGGMLWAWSLHAVLDVVIFSLALAAGASPDATGERAGEAPGSPAEPGGRDARRHRTDR